MGYRLMLFVKDILLRLYWHPFKRVIQKMPVSHVYFAGRSLGAFIYQAARDKRRRLEQELALIPSRKTGDDEDRKAVQEAFTILMCNEIEVLLFPVLSKDNISSYVICSGLANLDQALSCGKGAMLLFAHFGANQMIMPAIGYRGYKMSQLSAPATVWKEKMPDRRFSKAEEHAMKERRRHEESLPVQHINIFGSVKEAFLCLKRNEILGLAIDGGGGGERIPVRFLGREALFSIGAADIASRTGCAILPTFMVRNKNGRNTLIIEASFHADQGGNINAMRTRTTQRFAQRLEEYVIQYPSHYINFLALRHLMAQKGDTPLFR